MHIVGQAVSVTGNFQQVWAGAVAYYQKVKNNVNVYILSSPDIPVDLVDNTHSYPCVLVSFHCPTFLERQHRIFCC